MEMEARERLVRKKVHRNRAPVRCIANDSRKHAGYEKKGKQIGSCVQCGHRVSRRVGPLVAGSDHAGYENVWTSP